MPPKPDELSPTQIAIVVVVVLAGSALTIAAITLCVRRRKKRNNPVRYLNPQLRGGGEYDQEVIEYMKSSAFDDDTPHGSPELDSRGSSAPRYELGYTTSPWQDIPRALQPGRGSTALPEYRPFNTTATTTTKSPPRVELEAISCRIELPPHNSDLTLRPVPLNFSTPSRDHFQLSRDDTKGHEEDGDNAALHSGPAGILKNADVKPKDSHRVSSPTIPALLQQTSMDGTALERETSPVSPLTVRGSVSTQSDKPRQVSFVSEVSTIQPAGMSRGGQGTD